MAKFRELTIQEEQQIQYGILKHYVAICKAENLIYYLAYGTLLGAVRDSGFIEWDDDIDIWMPRKDFNRFITVYPKYSDSRFFLQTFDTDPYCLATGLARLCVNNSLKWPVAFNKSNFHKGIYFDIFPLDNGFNNWKDDIYFFWFKVNQALLIRKSLGQSSYGGKSIVKKIVNWILYNTMTEELIRENITNIIKKFEKNEDKNVRIVLATAFAGKHYSFFKSGYFDNTIKLKFKDVYLTCPECYKEILSGIYGIDYMTPIKTKPSYTPAKIIEK